MLSGYENNLLKLMVECLDKHTTELKNLNTNLTNLNSKLDTLNSSFANSDTNFIREFNIFNNRLYDMMVLTTTGEQGLKVWLSNVGAW